MSVLKCLIVKPKSELHYLVDMFRRYPVTSRKRILLIVLNHANQCSCVGTHAVVDVPNAKASNVTKNAKRYATKLLFVVINVGKHVVEGVINVVRNARLPALMISAIIHAIKNVTNARNNVTGHVSISNVQNNALKYVIVLNAMPDALNV